MKMMMKLSAVSVALVLANSAWAGMAASSGGSPLLADENVEDSVAVPETLRGVVFTDVGMVERDVRMGTIRSSVGTGIRLTLPFLGQGSVMAIEDAVILGHCFDKYGDVATALSSTGLESFRT